MLQKTTQWMTDRLVERALPSIGGFMASALQRMLILGHVEHHNQLEEQARRYEAAGKPHLAKLIRNQAENLSLDDPFSSAPAICERLSDGTESGSELAIGIADATAKPKRSKKRPSKVDDQQDEQSPELGE
jgi:hypothetical protein